MRSRARAGPGDPESRDWRQLSGERRMGFDKLAKALPGSNQPEQQGRDLSLESSGIKGKGRPDPAHFLLAMVEDDRLPEGGQGC